MCVRGPVKLVSIQVVLVNGCYYQHLKKKCLKHCITRFPLGSRAVHFRLSKQIFIKLERKRSCKKDVNICILHGVSHASIMYYNIKLFRGTEHW